MGKGFKIVTMLALCLVLVAGLAIAACGKASLAALQKPTIEFTQYLKGSTVDLNEATLNQMAEGAGEASWKFGFAANMFPQYYQNVTFLDEMTASIFAPPYKSAKCGGTLDAVEWGMLDASDQTTVKGAIFANVLTPDQQNAVATAVAGFFDGVEAQLTPLLEEEDPSLTATTGYQTLCGSVSYLAAEGWAKDVLAGVHYRQAFYRWLAKQGVAGMAAAGTLIRLSVGEFSFKITNPNDYDISIDSLDFNAAILTADEKSADAAKLSSGDKMYIPANSFTTITLQVPSKQMDIITWMVVGGIPSATAQAAAADVWGQIAAGTAEWDVTLNLSISSDEETITESYELTWSPE